jgi:hypothetical protein
VSVPAFVLSSPVSTLLPASRACTVIPLPMSALVAPLPIAGMHTHKHVIRLHVELVALHRQRVVAEAQPEVRPSIALQPE